MFWDNYELENEGEGLVLGRGLFKDLKGHNVCVSNMNSYLYFLDSRTITLR